MNADTTQAVPTALAAFVRRQTPSWLHDGSPAPDGITDDKWRTIQEAARRHFFDRCAFEFGDAIARGFRVQELASGTLARGAEVGAVDGLVRRHESVTDPVLAQRAERALERARQERAVLEPQLMVSLESMVVGNWGGRGGEELVESAEQAIAAKRREDAAEKREAASLPVIEVGHQFQAIGKTFPPGRHSVQPEVLEALETWKSKLEAEARQRKWPGPNFRGEWPPYVIVAGSGPTKPPMPATVW